MNNRLSQITKFQKASGILLMLLMLFLVGKAQDNTLSQIRSSFDKYQSGVFHEKVFVHTDKEFYLAGELLWFKSYVSDAASNKASELSKVAYVELLDDAKKSVLQAKIAIKEGSGNGSVFLPVSLKSGNYILRAYTSWMMNFSPEFFFEKQITIVNSLSPDVPDALIAQNYDIQFFPEGGNMLANVENKIAFRVTSNTGSGITFKGSVIDERNDTVARFQPLKFGIGNFSFMPGQNKTYRAVIAIKGERQKVMKDLPAVQHFGYSLKVQREGTGNLNVKINVDQNTTGPVYLVIHNRQQVNFAEQGLLANGTASFMVDIDKLGEGISHMTVFNANFKPVSERLYFNRPQRQLNIQVVPDKAQYSLRNRVNIDIKTINKSLPGQADLSLSVYRLDSLTSISGADIFNYQWLTSELKGNVEHPEYYFQQVNAETDLALDNLMLTHGWRRFQWNDILKGTEQSLSFIPEFEGHIITGKIVDRRNGSPASGIMTFLSVPSKRTQIYSSRSDKEGRIRFFTKDLIGPGEIVVQTNVMQDSTYLIEIDNPFSDMPAQSLPSVFKKPEVSPETVLDHHVSTQVQNAFLTDKLRSFSSYNADSTSFYGKPDNVYKLDEFVRFRTTEEVLREYVPSVVIFRQRDNFNVVVDKRTAAEPAGSVPLLIFDGVPVFDRGNKIMAYDPAKIQSLEVLTKNSFLGDTMFNSIVSFTSLKGNLESFELDPRDLVLNYEGLQLQREFFSPVYETTSQQSSRLPDLRELLYWSPDVKTSSEGRSTLSFYTSDQAGKYIIVTQGISADGNPGSGTASFEVK